MSKKIKKRLPRDAGTATAKRSPGQPKCPVHVGTQMEYDSEKMYWRCPIDSCKMISMPEVVAEKGKPMMVRGDLEVVLADDPDGFKEGRIFIRPTEGNVFVDITEYVARVKALPVVGTRLTLDFEHVTDTRTRGRD